MPVGRHSLHTPEREVHLCWHTEQEVAGLHVHSLQAGRGCSPAWRNGARDVVAILTGA